MKKKMDFITNSSSTSFIAWGVNMEIDDLKKSYGRKLFRLIKIEENKNKHKKALSQGSFITIPTKIEEDSTKAESEYQEFLDDPDIVWSIENLFENAGLMVRQMPYEDSIMIGKCPFSMKPDETLNEYKQDICDRFKKCGMNITPENLYSIEECWMDN